MLFLSLMELIKTGASYGKCEAERIRIFAEERGRCDV